MKSCQFLGLSSGRLQRGHGSAVAGEWYDPPQLCLVWQGILDLVTENDATSMRTWQNIFSALAVESVLDLEDWDDLSRVFRSVLILFIPLLTNMNWQSTKDKNPFAPPPVSFYVTFSLSNLSRFKILFKPQRKLSTRQHFEAQHGESGITLSSLLLRQADFCTYKWLQIILYRGLCNMNLNKNNKLPEYQKPNWLCLRSVIPPPCKYSLQPGRINANLWSVCLARVLG